jgi:hypothetical protein
MIAPTLTRRLRACVPLAALVLLAFAGPSYGADPCNPERGACAFKFDEINPLSATVDELTCLGPDPGVLTGTVEDKGGGTYSNIPGNPFFHYHLTHIENGRIDFPNGVYVLDNFTEHFTYNSGTHPPVDTFTSVTNERGIVYGADGQPTGQVVKSHALAHFTWIDTNGNGDPDPGDDYKASVDHFRLTCR